MHHLEREDLKMLPERVPYGNKGTFGKVLLIAGSEGMCGAAYQMCIRDSHYSKWDGTG